MKRFILLWGVLTGACLLGDAQEQRFLLWEDDLRYLKPGEKSAYIVGAPVVKSENGENYVTVKDVRGVMRTTPTGTVCGDYEMRFSFRPKSKKWMIETIHHMAHGGSRRFRKDTLKWFKVKIWPHLLNVKPEYLPTYGTFAHIVDEPRWLGWNQEPFPRIPEKNYRLDPKAFGTGGTWIEAVLTVDQYRYTVSLDGKTVAEHPINPAAGGFNLNMFGEFDVKNISCTALRFGLDPFAESSMMTRDEIREAQKSERK